MIIFWGKRVTRKKVGYVADFCPMCRGAQTFLLKEVRSYSHIYYIPTSVNTLHGYERRCQGCKLLLSGAPRQYVAVPKKPAQVNDILARSFPAFGDVYGERMKVEDAVRRAPDRLPADVRRALIQQPFLVLSPLVEARTGQTQFDLVASLALVGGAMAGIIGAEYASTLEPNANIIGMVVSGVVGVAIIAWGMATTPHRFVRGKLVPRLARTLKPLKPSEAEIADVLRDLGQKKHKIAKTLTPQRIMTALATP